MYVHLYYYDGSASRKQVNSHMITDLFIIEFERTTTYVLSQFQELGTSWLVRASASSILKEGEWSHMGNIIVTIGYNWLPFVTISYNLSPSVTIGYHQLPSVTISYHRLPSVTICYHRLPSVTIGYHQLPSVTISYH